MQVALYCLAIVRDIDDHQLRIEVLAGPLVVLQVLTVSIRLTGKCFRRKPGDAVELGCGQKCLSLRIGFVSVGNRLAALGEILSNL